MSNLCNKTLIDGMKNNKNKNENNEEELVDICLEYANPGIESNLFVS